MRDAGDAVFPPAAGAAVEVNRVEVVAGGLDPFILSWDPISRARSVRSLVSENTALTKVPRGAHVLGSIKKCGTVGAFIVVQPVAVHCRHAPRDIAHRAHRVSSGHSPALPAGRSLRGHRRAPKLRHAQVWQPIVRGTGRTPR